MATSTPFGIKNFGTFTPTAAQAIFDQIDAPAGQTFWVDATNGLPGNLGSKQAPVRTITQALALCVSNRGDEVQILPGSYTENVIVSKNGVTLAGAILGGYERPDIVPAAGVPLTVTGQGVSVLHCRMAGTAADACVQQGNGFLYQDCVFDGDLTAAKCGLRMLPSNTLTAKTASEGQVLNSKFRGSAIGIGFDTSQLNGGSTDNLVQGNIFSANTIDIEALKSGAAGTYSLQVTDVIGNYFADKNKAVYVDLLTNIDGAAANQTGTLMNNYFNSTAALTNVLIKVNGTGFAVVAAYSAIGITNASAF